MPGCTVHLSFDYVILLVLNEINGDGDGDDVEAEHQYSKNIKARR